MPTEVFVNPLPRLPVHKLLFFDFPADYHAEGAYKNVNIEAPAIEEMYGKLGTPAKQQGHPVLRELYPEREDPRVEPYHDQIIDIDRKVRIDHTGRLSGSFVKYLTCKSYKSIVRMDAHPLTSSGNTVELYPPIYATLDPGQNQPNIWYWYDPKQRDQLLFTAQATFHPRQVGLQAGNLYRLIIRWEFWDHSVKPCERMPISGFHEAFSFQVSEATAQL